MTVAKQLDIVNNIIKSWGLTFWEINTTWPTGEERINTLYDGF